MSYQGVHIDIGGPLRISDIEMSSAFRSSFESRKIAYSLEPMEAWQLYGLISKGYTGFTRNALALSRSGRPFKSILEKYDPLIELRHLEANYVSHDDEPLVKDIASESENSYNANPSTRLNTGAWEGAKLLHEVGMPMTIVTESFAEGSRRWLRDVDLARYFPDSLVFGKDSAGQGAVNPKVALLNAASDGIGVPVKKSVYIADTLGDITAAREAGCDIGMVRHGMTPPDVLERLGKPDFMFNNLEEASRFLVGIL